MLPTEQNDGAKQHRNGNVDDGLKETSRSKQHIKKVAIYRDV